GACSSAPGTQGPGSSRVTPSPGGSSPAEIASPAATATTQGSAGPSNAPLSSDPLHALELVDVASGERFTIGQLAASQPVLLETMAIWCSNCRAQMHNVVAAHNQASFHSISLDVDPTEQPGDLAAYAQREGFDWRFAMADAELLATLRDRFGTAIAAPPGMPKVLFRTDGSIELIGLGELYSAEQVAQAVGG
ncbi:MAG TPA: hypothetical protein VH859_00415, partial [Candidatus Limnocylindria bacterium]